MKLHERVADVSRILESLARGVMLGTVERHALRVELENLVYETEDIARRLKGTIGFHREG